MHTHSTKLFKYLLLFITQKISQSNTSVYSQILSKFESLYNIHIVEANICDGLYLYYIIHMKNEANYAKHDKIKLK